MSSSEDMTIKKPQTVDEYIIHKQLTDTSHKYQQSPVFILK